MCILGDMSLHLCWGSKIAHAILHTEGWDGHARLGEGECEKQLLITSPTLRKGPEIQTLIRDLWRELLGGFESTLSSVQVGRVLSKLFGETDMINVFGGYRECTPNSYLENLKSRSTISYLFYDRARSGGCWWPQWDWPILPTLRFSGPRDEWKLPIDHLLMGHLTDLVS